MELQSKEVGQVLIVRPLIKRIDASCSNAFKDQFAELIDDGHHFIALNLSLLEFLDSSGLGAVVTNSKLLKKLHGELVLYGVTPTVMNLLRLTGMERVFLFAEDEAEALKLLEDKIKHPEAPDQPPET